jgi:hypothetical protein
MQTKLTLVLDAGLVGMAKREARRRDKSVSQMVGEFFQMLAVSPSQASHGPVTSSLIGVLKPRTDAELRAGQRGHLVGKHQ